MKKTLEWIGPFLCIVIAAFAMKIWLYLRTSHSLYKSSVGNANPFSDMDMYMDDLIGIDDDNETSSSSSSSSNQGVFEVHQPFVLELHDIRKDDPMPTDKVALAAAAAAKMKKNMKKKGIPVKDKSQSSISSDSLSEASSVAPSSTDAREEFYDAHESYHAMPGNQGAVVAAARLQQHSEHNQNSKLSPQAFAPPNQQTTTSTTRKEHCTITKPTSPPE